MVRFLTVIFVALAGIIVIMFNVISLFNALRFSKSRLYREANKTRQKGASLAAGLVPLTSEELGELSYQILPNKKSNGLKSQTITTIYNEPLLAYSGMFDKKFSAGYAIYFAHEREFSFIHLPDHIEVFIDEQPFARVMKDGSLRDAAHKVMAVITKENGVKEIITKDRTLAVMQPHQKASMLERVFYLRNELQPHEIDIVLALGLPEFTKNIFFR